MSEVHLKTFIGALAALAASLAASWIHWYGFELDPRFVVGTAVFAAVVLLGDMFSIRISDQLSISASDAALVLAVTVLGPTWAAVAAIPASLFIARRDWLRLVYEVSHTLTIVYLTGIVFSFTSQPLLFGNREPFSDILYGTLIAGVTLIGTSKAIETALVKVKFDQSVDETWDEDLVRLTCSPTPSTC